MFRHLKQQVFGLGLRLKSSVLANLKMSYSEYHGRKIFNDPIHGHIEFHPLCVKIIDTPQFQRLRYLKQIGACYFVYPGAAHNRFEHSLGVGYLAGRLARTLRAEQPELDISKKDVLCVQMAGLCHDLGHGPFSHMFDQEFIPKARPDKKWMHEEGSVMMFDHMLEENHLRKEFSKYEFDDQDITFIKELIGGPLNGSNGEWLYKGRGEQKSFLYEIVANKRNGIDVDKWDYFARDCCGLGIMNNFDHLRCMKFSRVVEVDNRLQICFREKEAETLYCMFQIRATIHRRATRHRVCNAIQAMIADAFLKADRKPLIPGRDGNLVRMSDCIEDAVAYTNLNDSIFHVILMSTDETLAESRILLNRIHQRKLYKFVGETYSVEEIFKDDEEKIKDDILSKVSENCKDKIGGDDILVRKVKLDYGMNEKNPIDNVRFYNKNNVNKAKKLDEEHTVSLMLPSVFAEKSIRVYCKKMDKECTTVVNQCFRDWCKEKQIKAKEEFSPIRNE